MGFHGRKWRGNRNRGPGRPFYFRIINKKPIPDYLLPFDKNNNPIQTDEEIVLYPDELESLRLVDCQNLTQIEAGEKMAVSRGTIWRLLQNGREKIVRALFLGKKIRLISVESED